MRDNLYPSVTRILQATVPQSTRDKLDKWKQKIGEVEAEEIRTSAMKRGDGYDAKVKAFYEQGLKTDNHALDMLLKDYQCHSMEQGITSSKHGYYGRYDIIFQVNDVFILNDFKGSSKPKREEWLGDYPLQISAYVMALLENGQKIDYAMITVILENDVQKFVFSIKQIEYYFRLFLKRLEQYNNQNLQHEKK
jgi:genome maintenance exonuclease 1